MLGLLPILIHGLSSMIWNILSFTFHLKNALKNINILTYIPKHSMFVSHVILLSYKWYCFLKLLFDKI